ncbi:MAG: penicillin-binding protein 2 [Candidatus Kerfeldbacteria bacterium]|nr:penicillin-binding protein 2 [Candidatus Kerfeldbacteria bacterium]
MKPHNPFEPFLPHEDIRSRRVVGWHRETTVDDFLDAPDRAAMKQRFAFPRLRLLSVLVLVTAVVFTFRLLQLQLVRGAELRDQSESNRVKRELLLASRGILFDRNHVPLTANHPRFTVTVIPAELAVEPATRATVLEALATIVGQPADDVRAALEHPGDDGRVELDVELTHEQAINLDVRFGDTPGIAVDAQPLRTYTLGPASSHLLGTLGKPTQEEVENGYAPVETLGKSGLEAVFEETLRGRNGVQDIERDSANREQRVIATERPRPGANLVLTIDGELQQHLYDELTAAIKRVHAPAGAAVAIDPRTGDVLGLVSVPGYDPNAFSRGLTPEAFAALSSDARLPLFNRAIAGEYPSGSTIKPFIAASALDERIITPSTSVQSVGGIQIGQWFFPDWKPGGHGTTDVRKAIAESVNTFFYMVGGGTDDFRGLGIETMTTHVRRFGFGSATGIDLPGERSGFLPSMAWKEEVKGDRWYIGDTYHFAIGQGDLLVTPLQLASGVATIANGGTRYRPHLVSAITSAEGETLKTFPPEVEDRRAAGTSSIGVVREGMRQTVLSGTAQSMQSVPVPVAGKTGTAQFGANDQTHSWLTAFAPYDEPTIALAVLVEAGGEGTDAALPVARSVLSWYFSRSQ